MSKTICGCRLLVWSGYKGSMYLPSVYLYHTLAATQYLHGLAIPLFKLVSGYFVRTTCGDSRYPSFDI